ncbi:MAG TPA: hypothetical protein DEW32_06610, partial [Dehalococcoidia bacterium]|nr:hypothetical protein [Dehalococcoidia bacterium]
MAYNHMNQFDLAKRDYDKAIHINPQFVIAYVNRGKVYFNLG